MTEIMLVFIAALLCIAINRIVDLKYRLKILDIYSDWLEGIS